MRHEGLMTRESVIRWPVHSGKPDINRTLPVWCGFFYGRAKDTGLDWEDVEAARQAGTLDALIKKASNR